MENSRPSRLNQEAHIIDHELDKYNNGRPSMLGQLGHRVPLLEGGDDVTESIVTQERESTA